MRNRLFKFTLLLLAAVGGVVAWQRKNETPAFDPGLRPSEPFRDPARESVRPPESPSAAVEVPTTEPDPVVPVAAPEVDDEADVGTSELPPVDAAQTTSSNALPQPPRGPFTTAPEGAEDDLKQISGVGPKLEQLLNEQGITTFAQVASLDDAQIDQLQSRMPQFPGRIRRDNWVEQAATLR